jgi:hypothetical protein
VDSTSTSEIELGTIRFPFKEIVYPFIELFNHYSDELRYYATIYVKENTQSTIHSGIYPLVVLSAGNLTIMPYSDDYP